MRRYTSRGCVRLGCLVVGLRGFHNQHRTPILPQVAVNDPDPATTAHPNQPPISTIQVGYLLYRNQVVRHTPHPLEIEMSYLIEREHQRYARHEGSPSATEFFAARGQSMDVLGRTEAAQIRSNFFGLELYKDATRVVRERYSPEKRLKPDDFIKPETLVEDGPPARHTLQRKLDDFLYLIICEAETGLWGVPYTVRKSKETLRMSAERAVATQHADGLDCYFWSNAPQGTVLFAEQQTRLFVYNAVYLTGRPHFATMEPAIKDHAWVTRQELLQYKEHFRSPSLLAVLHDITADSMFET